jgi:hAT family C-terminal dimerisation region
MMDLWQKNIFNNLLAFHMLQSGTLNELTSYLATMLEDVINEDVLHWLYEHKHVYTNLSRMALNYYTIPCKSLLLFTCTMMHISDYIHSSRYLY